LEFEKVKRDYEKQISDKRLELDKLRDKINEEDKAYRNRVLELQTVEKFIPHLTKNEESKKVALIAITTLGHDKISESLLSFIPAKV
jgi:hypothetical protein